MRLSEQKKIKKSEELRVIPQFTFNSGMVNLIAEEDHDPFKKGGIVKQIRRIDVYKMDKPLRVKISRHTKEGKENITVRIIRANAETH